MLKYDPVGTFRLFPETPFGSRGRWRSRVELARLGLEDAEKWAGVENSVEIAVRKLWEKAVERSGAIKDTFDVSFGRADIGT